MGVGWEWLLNMVDVAFISYRRLPSFPLASLIQEKLKNTHQISAYVDVTRTDGARVKFPERLMQAIADAPIFVCLLGRGTLDSEWVLKEIREAHRLEKPCIPVFQEKFPAYSGDDPAVKYLLTHDGVHVLDVRGIHIDYSVLQIVDLIRKTLGISTSSLPVKLTIAPTTKIDIYKEIERYYAAMDAEKWYEARDILEKILASNQTAPAFYPTREASRLGEVIATLESNVVRDKAYSFIQRRYPRLSMAELKEAMTDFWQTYPNYDPSYLVKPRPHVWINIPVGKVTLIEKYEDKTYLGKRGESKTFDIPMFEIGKYPVTRAQYDEFIHDGGYQNDIWWKDLAKRIDSPLSSPTFTRPDHPRVDVSWFEAVAYCRWLSAKLRKVIILPTEQQWQRAAQGDDKRPYPWGKHWDMERCNTLESHLGGRTFVGQYEGKGDSPYGVVDMLGNIWEWCLNDYHTGNTDFGSEGYRAVRGGSFAYNRDFTGTSFRYSHYSSNRDDDHGFRVVALVS